MKTFNGDYANSAKIANLKAHFKMSKQSGYKGNFKEWQIYHEKQVAENIKEHNFEQWCDLEN